MKVYRLFTILVLVSLFLAACGGGGEAESKELNLYGWSEYVPQALLDKFTEETGIAVNYDTYSSNEELMAKLQAGASGYDVIIPSDYTVSILKNGTRASKLKSSFHLLHDCQIQYRERGYCLRCCSEWYM